MRNLLIAVAMTLPLGILACTSDDPGVLVSDLTDTEQRTLCEAVLDDCTDVRCSDPCIDTGCQAAVDMGAIDAECANVFDDEDAAVDLCIVDALDSICP